MRENEYRSAMLARDLQWRYGSESRALLGTDQGSNNQNELLLAKDDTKKQRVRPFDTGEI